MSDATKVAFQCLACGIQREFDAAFAGRKVKCKCGNIGVVPETGRGMSALFPQSVVSSPVENPPPTNTASPTNNGWWLSNGGSSTGPHDEASIIAGLKAGTISPQTQACAVGGQEWKQLMELSVFAAVFPFASPASSSFPPPPPSLMPNTITEQADIADPPTNPPALWNPNAIANWSGGFTLINGFSWAVGVILVAKNWKALGQPQKAKWSMMWLCWLFLITIFVLSIVPRGISLIGNFIPLLIWYFIEVKPQVKFVQATYDNQYPKNGWGIPIAIWIGLTIVVVALGLFLLFASNELK